MKLDTTTLVKTAVLGALVVVFDYSMKFSGFKIPFPWLPFLKFDFTGIPIVLSTLIIGFQAGVTTSIVAFLAILVRSGDIIGASMKGLAELWTVLGMSLGLIFSRDKGLTTLVSFALGCTSRVLAMVLANLLILPLAYGIPMSGAIALTPLVATFNVIHGFLSMFGARLIYEALKHRAPSLVSRT